ncbi:putative rna- rbd [Golovinomyces cichoracearum]|uniref:Putative rna-rbd n=1 Tax=Golovinomyces cichoracearum TaxID=62708 RepID=A0A420HG19_9PEZI|nr:putative rna- rbd [Golovinomyces cichoracearum]
MAPSKPAVDFNAIVQTERRRRKNEIAAQQMFDKARGLRVSDRGAKYNKTGKVPSLASRVGPVGISKRNHSAPGRPKKNANPEEDWTHELHRSKNIPVGNSYSTPRGGSRMVRSNFNDRRFTSDSNPASSPAFQNNFSIVGTAKPAGGLSIRGLAGPYTVIVKNLATGTTAADIESAMAPVGGLVLSCRLVAEQPRVIAEIILETKEGADNIVETFNNQSADGNILHVYHKVGPSYSNDPQPTVTPRQIVAPRGPRADLLAEQLSEDSRSYVESDSRKSRGRSKDHYTDYERDNVVDGSYGFNDRMDINNGNDTGRRRGLYSDNIISGKYGRRTRGDGSQSYR